MPDQIDIYRGDRSDFALYAKLGSRDDTEVVGVDTNADEFTLSGDRTQLVSIGERVLWSLTDTDYEVGSLTYNSGPDQTVIGTVESISRSAAAGYLLFPWDVGQDFKELRAQARYAEQEGVLADWRTKNPSGDYQDLTLKDGDGTGDKMVFSVPPGLFDVDHRQRFLEFDVEGLDANDEPVTILKRHDVQLSLTSDITRV